ncbi:unnamed protein product [Linum trigynum]|uniref:Uncharacterized protein n=1 Tax=Linum trigynum TaxID=586398 RepID=A0AAV2F762_9ROSI
MVAQRGGDQRDTFHHRSPYSSTQEILVEHEELLKSVEEKKRDLKQLCSRIKQDRLFDIIYKEKEEVVEEEGISKVDNQVDLDNPSIDKLA